MRLLYVADNGFSKKNGDFYYTRPNEINVQQYGKYFESICFLARDSAYVENSVKINQESRVVLVKKNDIWGLLKAMHEMKSDYDAVLLRNGINGCIVVGTAKKLGKIVLAYCGSDPYVSLRNKSVFKAFIRGYLEKRKMLLADFAQYCTNYLYKNYPSKCKPLICSNVNIITDEKAISRRISKIKSNDSGKTVLGLVGDLNSNRKRQVDAINVIKILGKSFHLELVGSGSGDMLYSFAEKLGVRSQVECKGYIADKNKLMAWYDSIDIYIQPSVSEGLPRSIIEAMSRGCPCIATCVGGNSDIIEEQYLVEPLDIDAMCNIIGRITSKRDIMIKMAKENYEISRQYAIENRNQKMDEYYGKLVDM